MVRGPKTDQVSNRQSGIQALGSDGWRVTSAAKWHNWQTGVECRPAYKDRAGAQVLPIR